MKISEAIEVLNITNYTIYNIKNISYNELKKHYHIQCLINHPDKNINNEKATLVFQNINQAYNSLRELINISKDDSNYDDSNSNIDNNNYNHYILNFINFVTKYYCNSENNSKLEDLEENINNIKCYANSHIQTILVNLLDNFSITILVQFLSDLLFYI